MAVATYKQITDEIRKGAPASLYILHGKEPYYIDQLAHFMVENILDETERAFGQTIFYGRDASAAQIVNVSKAFPMMGNRQLVVVREAQDLADMKKKENLALLTAYASNPLVSTTLIFCFKYSESQTAGLTTLLKAAKAAVVFESKPLYDSQIPKWITEFTAESGYSITNKAAQMLNEFLGTDLEKIANELNKLYINHPQGKPITEEVIEKYIGISKDYNVFELQKALAQRNVLKSNQIVTYFAANPKNNSIFALLPRLFAYFSKVLLIHSLENKSEESVKRTLGIWDSQVPEYMQAARNYNIRKLFQITSLLRETNAMSVGIDNNTATVDEGKLMKELIFKILH